MTDGVVKVPVMVVVPVLGLDSVEDPVLAQAGALATSNPAAKKAIIRARIATRA